MYMYYVIYIYFNKYLFIYFNEFVENIDYDFIILNLGEKCR